MGVVRVGIERDISLTVNVISLNILITMTFPASLFRNLFLLTHVLISVSCLIFAEVY